MSSKIIWHFSWELECLPSCPGEIPVRIFSLQLIVSVFSVGYNIPFSPLVAGTKLQMRLFQRIEKHF